MLYHLLEGGWRIGTGLVTVLLSNSGCLMACGKLTSAIVTDIGVP